MSALCPTSSSKEYTNVIVNVTQTKFSSSVSHSTQTSVRHINKKIPLYQFPRVDPDGDASCTHLKNPSLCLHARVEAVSVDQGSQVGAAVPRCGKPPYPPPAIPRLPQSRPKPKSGGRQPKQLPHHKTGGYPHLSGR